MFLGTELINNQPMLLRSQRGEACHHLHLTTWQHGSTGTFNSGEIHTNLFKYLQKLFA